MKNLLLSMVLVSVLTSSSFASMADDPLRATFMLDNFEYQFNDEKSLSWDAYAYIGYDLNKIYIYTEGEKADGESSVSENQLLYSKAILPYWDIQGGIAYDKNENASKTWGVLALSGLAPYFFETRATLLIAEDGNIGFRASAEYEALITQKLILSPSLELTAYTKDSEEMGVGAGFSNLTLGARVRYEIKREFAPYIGLEWSKNFANTDKITSLNSAYATVGLRTWF